ncbi:MAG: hypothetical protein INR65_01865 [Gluconacetobacter diazotrophicus]|nr:hypothetical protein [Gluconacetobacter diazotrophicus]
MRARSHLRLAGTALAMLPLLAGCGFRPLYGAGNAAAVAQLPDIFVMPIPERSGQELRLALQQRLAGTSEAQPQGYDLAVSYNIAGEAVGIHGDNTSERTRLVGRAHWVLSAVSPNPTTVATGDARALDGYESINEQYVASTIANETTQGRLANNLADQITTQLTTWFAGRRAPPTAASSTVTAPNLAPRNVPGDSDQSPLNPVGLDGLPASATGRSAITP